MSIEVSVVVPTCNRNELLERCLEALVSQDFAPDAYEILIVDDAASHATRQLIERWQNKTLPCIRYLAGKKCGPAVARNLAWRQARGRFIAFTDDDCQPQHDWLSAGMAAFQDGTGALSGRVIVPLPPVPTDYERNAALLSNSDFVTANCFLRRDVLERLNGFDERFTAPWREDSDLFFSLLKADIPWKHVPQAIVVHPIRPAPWGISIQQQQKSMFNALLYKKHPELYRERVQATPPLQYYGMLSALLLAVFGLSRRSKALTLLGGLFWFSLTGRFCLRRLRHTSRAPAHVLEMIVTSVLIPPLAIFWRLRGALKFRVFFW
ncbi:GT2 family glycosyltransferase [Thermosporothrix hazakensis]|jgi:glycosyltransferase involved in cell wall biosynthesis|uniref:GT2 family glycosyltransferase n=2 Tax=Thermosporothrix TaxID=768650 RepID=A0A326U606_THEHA|nr:glycosyltransferase [Thermosporothrix hazakensis]PZW29406.1 GT2 family glycosyltransferase [Thermosporothrix hazakensis]BBH85693.1 glycosyl transferase [Thermosporothrix sp. COM3]GCE45878.1 glycosyl transferase [Thermosporothrix hazakensis]